ncbi:MAG: hypothetical protein OXC31_18075 [Spirochaetaceae bacterium]|nr:hypothetical protein [Spirochaetaceae bacterium]
MKRRISADQEDRSGQEALPVVVGRRIDPADPQRAEAAGVRYVTSV